MSAANNNSQSFSLALLAPSIASHLKKENYPYALAHVKYLFRLEKEIIQVGILLE